MVTKNKTEETGEKKGRVKIDKLELNKETVKDLTNEEAKKIKGGKTGNCMPFSVPAAGCTGVQI